MNNNNKKHKDLIAHYFNNEIDHIPLLIQFLKNEKQLSKETTFSNLFNFKVDFDKKEVIIEDECGLFVASNPKRSKTVSLEKLLLLCNKRMKKK